MRTAYIDEAGYTGRNLLDPTQPFLALSGVFISEDDARALRDRLFQGVKARELKHQSLARRRQHHRGLLQAQQACLRNYNAVSYVADKRFLCILKLLNDCIEPCLYARGLDFYENGQHLALAGLLYHTGPTLWGREPFQRLLDLYQEASAKKTDDAIGVFCSHARSLPRCGLSPYIQPIAAEDPAFLAEVRSPTTSTNAVFSLLSGLLTQLEHKAGGPYEIVHDTSPAMKAYHEALRTLMGCSESRRFRISNVCTMRYPLDLKGIREAESTREVGLQLADLLAGGIVAATEALCSPQGPDAYTSEILALYSDDNLMHLVPTLDFDDIARDFAGSQAGMAIDFMTRIRGEDRGRTVFETRRDQQ